MKPFEKRTVTSNEYVVPQDVWLTTALNIRCDLSVIEHHINNGELIEALDYIKEVKEKFMTAKNAVMRVDEFMNLVVQRLQYLEREDLKNSLNNYGN